MWFQKKNWSVSGEELSRARQEAFRSSNGGARGVSHLEKASEFNKSGTRSGSYATLPRMQHDTYYYRIFILGITFAYILTLD
jgi:hypothetical protein